MTIAIIIAMEKEFSRIASLLSSPDEQQTAAFRYLSGKTPCGNTLVMQRCGIGKVNAAVGATELILRYHPDVIISSGVAGGASLSLQVKDVVVSTEVAHHDAYYGTDNEYGQVQGLPAKYITPSQLVRLAHSASADIREGLIVSGDWFVDSKDKMRAILDHFPDALAVDMESAAIAQTAHLFGVPFVSFRIISDIALADNNFQMYKNFWDDIAEGSFTVTHRYIDAIDRCDSIQ
jgi:adenosylhomocysteine nucleosidase